MHERRTRRAIRAGSRAAGTGKARSFTDMMIAMWKALGRKTAVSVEGDRARLEERRTLRAAAAAGTRSRTNPLPPATAANRPLRP